MVLSKSDLAFIFMWEVVGAIWLWPYFVVAYIALYLLIYSGGDIVLITEQVGYLEIYVDSIREAYWWMV